MTQEELFRFRCDGSKCKSEIIAKDFQDAIILVGNAGWRKHNKKDLCATCLKKVIKAEKKR